jgi:Transcriptional regulator SbtR-like, C-terminal domain
MTRERGNVLDGVGFGLAFSAMSALVVAAVPASQTGVASGMNANIRTIDELTARATAAGTVNPGITTGDVMALIWAMRGLVQAAGEVAPEAWQRFLDIQLAGMRAAGPFGTAPPISSRQLSKLAPR